MKNSFPILWRKRTIVVTRSRMWTRIPSSQCIIQSRSYLLLSHGDGHLLYLHLLLILPLSTPSWQGLLHVLSAPSVRSLQMRLFPGSADLVEKQPCAIIHPVALACDITCKQWPCSNTLLRNHIQPERSGTDRFFSYYHFSYIYGLFHCIFKIFHWGPSEKMPVLYAAMAENHFRVAKSGFWGEFSQVWVGTLGGSVFRNFSIRWSEVPFPRYRN